MNEQTEDEKPIVFVVGASGTGKSELAITLAENCNGECVNADSMQVYKGLDVVTNKPSAADLGRVPHHLFGFVEVDQQLTVADFVEVATKIIDDIQSRGRIPIVVGGTMLYIEALLFQSFVMLEGHSQMKSELDVRESHTRDEPSSASWERLREVDPSRAAQLHEKDVRRIARSLEVFSSTHELHSTLMRDKKLRNKRHLVLWIDVPLERLDPILDERVDKMIENGLLEEIEALYQSCGPGRRGIQQSIGYKEFMKYLELGSADTDTLESRHVLDECVRLHKAATRRYVRTQLRWITNRFGSVSMCRLAADESIDSLRRKAVEVVSTFANGLPISREDLFKSKRDDAWDNHVRGRPHRSAVRKRSKRNSRVLSVQ